MTNQENASVIPVNAHCFDSFVEKPVVVAIAMVLLFSFQASAQSSAYPKEIRAYKVERAAVEVKKSHNANKNVGEDTNENALVRFGDPQLARATPLGITFELPLVIAPVKQKGHVDFLVFEEMTVNDTSVEIDEYHRGFDLPNRDKLTLREPLRVFIYLPRALVAAIDEWNAEKKTWIVTGRVYVFGRFKKGLFTFKRCIPVELKFSMPNPLRN